jgi:hypothetical protein
MPDHITARDVEEGLYPADWGGGAILISGAGGE